MLYTETALINVWTIDYSIIKFHSRNNETFHMRWVLWPSCSSSFKELKSYLWKFKKACNWEILFLFSFFFLLLLFSTMRFSIYVTLLYNTSVESGGSYRKDLCSQTFLFVIFKLVSGQLYPEHGPRGSAVPLSLVCTEGQMAEISWFVLLLLGFWHPLRAFCWGPQNLVPLLLGKETFAWTLLLKIFQSVHPLLILFFWSRRAGFYILLFLYLKES